tara:strand:+ start:171 stop:467 length:297 start_codon:yes stop_codon:yes gene_type:complete
MALVVEYVMQRPSTDVEFPVLDSQEQSSVESLRERYHVNSAITISEDGLTWTMRQSCDDVTEYGDFYQAAGPHWDKSKIVTRCSEHNIDISMSIVENT